MWSIEFYDAAEKEEMKLPNRSKSDASQEIESELRKVQKPANQVSPTSSVKTEDSFVFVDQTDTNGSQAQTKGLQNTYIF